MAGALLGGLFGGGKKDPAPSSASTSTYKPIIKPLAANDPLRQNKGVGLPDYRSAVATILSDKLGN